jgi:hypothetical protein
MNLANTLERRISAFRRLLRGARWLAVTLALWLSLSGLALAAPKKKEKEAAPTKSYVASYFILIMVLGVGLMTVCRPGRRLDKPPEKIKDEE